MSPIRRGEGDSYDDANKFLRTGVTTLERVNELLEKALNFT
jgi:hypothetical protein